MLGTRDRANPTYGSRHHGQEQEGCEDDQVHDALKHRGPAGAQCDDSDEQRQGKQRHLLCAEPKVQRLPKQDRYGGNGRNGQTDAC